jgi:hypothetical protein
MAKKKVVEVDKSVRLFHYGRPTADDPCEHSGVISIASKADYNAKTVNVGFGFCSPLDPFRRTKGRNISTGRVAKNAIVLKFDDNPAKAIKKFLVAIWEEGKKLYDPMISNKELKERLQAFYSDVPLLGVIDFVEIPYKAVKHFPFAFAWAQDVQFPAEWVG